jgi:hypothetical protein
MPDTTSLRNLLGRVNSHESCSGVIAESWQLSQAGGPYAWFFLLLNRTFISLIDQPDMFYGVSESTPSPVLSEISRHALEGLGAIERDDPRAVMASANFLRYP